MAFYARSGTLAAKHFTTLTGPGDRVFHEELISTAGFDGPSSLLYRLNPPTRVVSITTAEPNTVKPWDDVVRNHLLVVDRLVASGDVLTARRVLAFNDTIDFSVAKPERVQANFLRNGYADELVCVVAGSGVLRSPFGDIAYGPLDYLYVPRGVTVQWLMNDEPHTLALVESREPITIPARFRNQNGQLLEKAPYHERDLRLPVLADPVEEHGEFEILIKTGARVSRCVVDSHPFDVVGWDGSMYPFALNMRDYEPVTGYIHQLPDVYQVFATRGAAICNMTPRAAEQHPGRSPAQVHHTNVDFDEILYRVHSDCAPSTRPGAEPGVGTVTVHRRSMPHGPKAGYESRPLVDRMDAFMFMVDTEKPLTVTMAAKDVDDPGYVQAWL